MNERFRDALEKSGKTAYVLARESGVPYTTISELKNNKSSINRCPAEKVFRLAFALNTQPSEIMDEVIYLDGIRGRYKSVSYVWKYDREQKQTVLSFKYKGTEVALETDHLYNNPSRLWAYGIIAGWRIQDHIDKSEWRAHAESVYERTGERP